MKPPLAARQNNRPWLALLAAASLVLAIPAGRFAAVHIAPAEDLPGHGGLAAGLSGMRVALLAGPVRLAIVIALARVSLAISG